MNREQQEQLRYQLSKFFARRSGVLITDTSLQVLATILTRQTSEEGGDEATARLIETLRSENAGYTNRHFTE